MGYANVFVVCDGDPGVSRSSKACRQYKCGCTKGYKGSHGGTDSEYHVPFVVAAKGAVIIAIAEVDLLPLQKGRALKA